MSNLLIEPYCFMGAGSVSEPDKVILGLPFDSTTSNRPGARFGPAALRQASWGLEEYSPFADAELKNDFQDWGDLELPFGNPEKIIEPVRHCIRKILDINAKPVVIGGEHGVSFPVIAEVSLKFPGLKIIHLDAHADLRPFYLTEKYSHASVMHNSVQLIGSQNLLQLGIRSGTRAEFEFIKKNKCLQTLDSIPQIISEWKQTPVYLTIDIDVFDPACAPGTGTPEPGGWFYQDFEQFLQIIRPLNIVGFDVVEVASGLDHGVTAILGAKVLRELLIAF